MKRPFQPRCAMLAAAICLPLLGGPAWAQAPGVPVAGARPSFDTFDAQPGTPASGEGNVAELALLVRDGTLYEMRTTYNGSYGASLFLHARDMIYYVALFQDRHFWRVIQTPDRARADAVYAAFVAQTAKLAEIEIRRTELQAQKALLDRIIATQNDQAKRLQADLDVARAQQARVTEQQRQARSEAEALQVEKEAAQLKLRDLQRQVQQLQRQTDMELPAPKSVRP